MIFFEVSKSEWSRVNLADLVINMTKMVLCSCFDIIVVQLLSHVQLFRTLWTVACQAPLSMGFSRRECWSELPFPSSVGSSWPWDQTHVSCIGRWILCHWVPGKPFDIITFTLFLFSKIETAVGTQYMLRGFSLRAGWVGYTGMWCLVKQWNVNTFPFVLPILFFSNTSCYQI